MKKITNNCSYDASTGIMLWKKGVVNPGDFIEVKHAVSDGYNSKTVREAGMFLGVKDNTGGEIPKILFQIGVRQEQAYIEDIKKLNVLSRMEECEG